MIDNPTLTRLIRRNIYAMKRQYGLRVDFYRVVSSETNHLNGVKTVVKEVNRIRRAPVLPYRMRHTIAQTISTISAAKDFVYGAAYDSAMRDILIDARDLPKDMEIRPEDYFVFDGQRWDVVSAERYEYKSGWVVSVRVLPGMPPWDIQDLLVTQDLALAESASVAQDDELPESVRESLGLSDSHSVVKQIGRLPTTSMGLNLTQTVQVQVE